LRRAILLGRRRHPRWRRGLGVECERCIPSAVGHRSLGEARPCRQWQLRSGGSNESSLPRCHRRVAHPEGSMGAEGCTQSSPEPPELVSPAQPAQPVASPSWYKPRVLSRVERKLGSRPFLRCLTVGALAAAGPSRHIVKKSIPQLAARRRPSDGFVASGAPTATSAG
jgi:hypothetical protein